MPKLYIAENGEETVYEIFDNEVSLGRGAANDVQIHGSAASKMHAVIRELEGHWKVIDLESRNGTVVNGAFRNQHWLSDGDTVRIGDASLRYAAEGAPGGSPAAAAPAKPVAAKPAAAKPAAAKPALAETPVVAAAPTVAAKPAIAEPAPAEPSAGTFEEQPAFSAPVTRSARAAGAPSSRRSRQRDDYDDYDDDDDFDDRAPRRRSSNNGMIIVLGIVGGIAFMIIMFSFLGGASVNQEVFAKADKIADGGKYEEALKYAERNADPDADHYWAIVKGMEKWRKLIKAKKKSEFEAAARHHYDYEIFRKQAVTGRRKGGFRAKDAYPEHEVAKMLRDFLLEYPGSFAAMAVIGGKQSDYVHLRDCMLENRDPDIKSSRVIQGLTAQHDIDVSAKKFGEAYLRLDYLRTAYKLIMTSENYTEFRQAIQLKIDDVLDTATSRWKDDEARFKGYLADGARGKAGKQLSDMKESYGGIPDFAAKLQELDQKL